MGWLGLWAISFLFFFFFQFNLKEFVNYVFFKISSPNQNHI
jgi:hypothetical protein